MSESMTSGADGVTTLARMKADLISLLDTADSCDGAALIDEIRLLEEITSIAAAVQGVRVVAFDAQQRAQQAVAGVPAERQGRGVAAQLGLARRMSPWAAARQLGQLRILTTELPATFAQLAAGVVPEWRALKVAQQTAWLSREHRAVVDAEIAPQLERLGHRRTVDLTNTLAYRLDPHGYLAHLNSAEKQRTVSIRPAPECMTRLSALLPLAQGVAAYAALKHAADTYVGVGDEPRSRGQIMADTLVERITGQATAGAVPIAVSLIMTDQALFSYGEHPDEPAHLIGAGTIPADLARRLLRDAATGNPVGETSSGPPDPSSTAEAAAITLRRLYTDPTTGQLAAMESRARIFPANQAHFLVLRDHSCRTPWCNAPIRHSDHVTPYSEGGATGIDDGAGLCEACNYAKQALDFQQHVLPDGSIETITPTGHRYLSPVPDPPGATRPPEQTGDAEKRAA